MHMYYVIRIHIIYNTYLHWYIYFSIIRHQEQPISIKDINYNYNIKLLERVGNQ